METRTSHDSSHCTYEVDKPALYTNILRWIPVSTTLIIILLKPNIVWWPNGRPSDYKGEVSEGVRVWQGKWTRTTREETVLTENCYGIYEEQADVKYTPKEKHGRLTASMWLLARVNDFELWLVLTRVSCRVCCHARFSDFPGVIFGPNCFTRLQSFMVMQRLAGEALGTGTRLYLDILNIYLMGV